MRYFPAQSAGKAGIVSVFLQSFAVATLLSSACAVSAAAQDAPQSTLEKIKQTKTVAIAYHADTPPFSYRTSDGKVQGYSIELCNRVVDHIRDRLGLDKIDINFVEATAATRFLLVKSGKVDMECSTTTNNAERREIVAFSYPHFVTATRFVSKKASNLVTIKDLSGRTVVSTTGTINVEQLQSRNRADNLNISVMLAKQYGEAFSLVEKDKASAFVMDGSLLAALVASSQKPSDYIISTEAFGPPEPYGILMRKDDETFKTAVNEELREIFTGGEINDIYERWFMSPTPPEGLNFNLPVSPELQAAFLDPQDYLK
jgi:glutamate/aspartate transport system substrate-binding protein